MSGSDPRKQLGRQGSISSLEQSLNMVKTPPNIAPVTIYPGPAAKHANLAKADLEIVQRLNQLRKSGNDVPSETEMAERLAKLKGLPIDYYTNKPSQALHVKTDNRTDVEKSADLLNQIAEEVSLDRGLGNPDDDIAARLAQLRCVTNTSTGARNDIPINSPDSPQGLEDMDEVAKLVHEASMAADAEAKLALADLTADHAVMAEIKKRRNKATRVQRKGGHSSSTEEAEKYSDSSSDKETKRRYQKKSKKREGKEAKEEEEEVKKIVNFYSKRAQKKKKKGVKSKHSSTDSSSELSDCDAKDREKLSDSSSGE